MRIVLPLPLPVVKAIFGFLATKRIREWTTRRKPKRSNNGQGAISHDDIDSRALRVRMYVDASDDTRYAVCDDGGIDDGDDEDNVDITAEEERVLGEACTSNLRSLANINNRAMGKSHMQNHVSALKAEYSTRRVMFRDPNIPIGEVNNNDWLTTFVLSYNRIIGDKKERGAMKLGEGKRAVLPEGVQKTKQFFHSLYSPSTKYIGKKIWNIWMGVLKYAVV